MNLLARSRNLLTRCAIALSSLTSSTCAIESSDACDANQVFRKGGTALKYAVCVCDEANGWVFDELRGYGCKRCAEGQTIIGSRCTSPPPAPGTESDGGRMPTGIGQPCLSDTDCVRFDAKFCAPQINTCMLDKCATGENVCTPQSTCCDFSAFLAGLSLCLPDDQIVDGKCPMGGTRVDR